MAIVSWGLVAVGYQAVSMFGGTAVLDELIARLQEVTPHYGKRPEVARSEEASSENDAKRACKLVENLVLEFSSRIDANNVRKVLATTTVNPSCTVPVNIPAEKREMLLVEIHPSRIGFPELQVKMPPQALTRQIEMWASGPAAVVQCNLSSRGDAAERELCEASDHLEAELEKLLDDSRLSRLRQWSGPYQWWIIWSAVMLVLWSLLHTHSVRAAYIGATKMHDNSEPSRKLPWEGVETIEQARAAWGDFLFGSAGNVDGSKLAQASPYLYTHGAAIVAMENGVDPYEAVDDAARALRDRTDITGGVGRYLIFAIPTFGFLGTASGLSQAMALVAKAGASSPATQALAKASLGNSVVIAFDTTVVALICSLVAVAFTYGLGQVTESAVSQARNDAFSSLQSGSLRFLLNQLNASKNRSFTPALFAEQLVFARPSTRKGTRFGALTSMMLFVLVCTFLWWWFSLGRLNGLFRAFG